MASGLLVVAAAAEIVARGPATPGTRADKGQQRGVSYAGNSEALAVCCWGYSGAEAVARGLLAVATAAVEIAAGGRRPEAVRLPLHGALLNVVAMAGGGAHAALSPAAVAAVIDGA